MSTIPSKPLGEFNADSSYPTGGFSDVRVTDSHGDMNCMPLQFSNVIITKTQAMAFFDLVPRYNPDEEMGATTKYNCSVCGYSTCKC